MCCNRIFIIIYTHSYVTYIYTVISPTFIYVIFFLGEGRGDACYEGSGEVALLFWQHFQVLKKIASDNPQLTLPHERKNGLCGIIYSGISASGTHVSCYLRMKVWESLGRT